MKILLALDFSPSSETALNEAASRRWPIGTSIEVLHVVESESVDDPKAMSLVKDAVARLSSRGIAVSHSILQGDPKDTIVEHSRNTGADFIMVGSHSKSGLARILLGSVAASVVRHAACSVVVVRAANPP